MIAVNLLTISTTKTGQLFGCAPNVGNHNHWRVRAATTPMEIIISLFLLATLAVLSGQIIASVVQTRLEQRKRAWAMQEAGNAMEKAFLLPWAELEPGQSRECTSSESARRFWKDLRTTIFTEATDDEKVRRLVIRVEWSTVRNQAKQQIQLVAFRHRPHLSAEIATAAKVTENQTRASKNVETRP